MDRTTPSEALWRVVSESRPLAENSEVIAVIRAFTDYEEAWQFAHAAHEHGAAVELFDPRGRLLIDAGREQAFDDIRPDITQAPAGIYRWVFELGWYQLVKADPAELRRESPVSN